MNASADQQLSKSLATQAGWRDERVSRENGASWAAQHSPCRAKCWAASGSWCITLSGHPADSARVLASPLPLPASQEGTSRKHRSYKRWRGLDFGMNSADVSKKHSCPRAQGVCGVQEAEIREHPLAPTQQSTSVCSFDGDIKRILKAEPALQGAAQPGTRS